MFYGCTNYPKCDFTSNAKPVPEKCPECGNPYLVEKVRVAGTYLVCPNNRKSSAEDEAPKKKLKKGAAAEPADQVVCGYSKKIAEPQIESVEAMRYQTKAEALPVA
jgi:DNA topoisomerase-1